MKPIHARDGWFRSAALLAILAAFVFPLLAQEGPEPRSERRNYPLGGLGLPMPDLPEVNYKGKLERLDKKFLVLRLDDGRLFNFERSGKTKFYRGSQRVKSSEFHIGDRVSVDAVEDPQAFLDAVRVSFDNSPPASQQSGKPSGAGKTPGSAPARPFIRYGENGRPTLRRRAPAAPAEGGTPEPARSAASAGSSASRGAPANSAPGFPSPVDLPSSPDPFIEKARTAALSLPAKLPDFVCQEVMRSSTRAANAPGWQQGDRISAEVVYEDGKERHQNVRINGRPTQQQQLSDSWPIARLISALSDLFSPATAARFRFGGESDLVDLRARVYDFDVKKENSRWLMSMGSESIAAAYGGSVWIDRKSGRVLRLEMQARDLPPSFSLNRVEAAAEYSLVRVGEQQVFLPTHVETMACQRNTHTCSQSVVDFTGFRKDTANSGTKSPRHGPS